MARKSSPFMIPESEYVILRQWLTHRTVQRSEYERAYMIIESSKGRPPSEIAKELNTYSNKVIAWRKSYLANGLKGLKDKPRSGRSKIYSEEFKHQVLTMIGSSPPKGYSRW